MLSIGSTADHDSHQVLVTPFSDTVNMLVLGVATEAHQTIPAGATRVLFSGTTLYYVKIGPTGTQAAIPGGSVTDGTGSVPQASGYALKPTDTTISCISPAACIVSLEYFS